jgi:serine/threonine protein kinase
LADLAMVDSHVHTRAAALIQGSDRTEAFAVLECLSTCAPANYEICRLLSDQGKHKLVFLARASSKTGHVVLKKLRDSSNIRSIHRDLGARTDHPHIIATDLVENSLGEVFFIEPPLDEVVDLDHIVTGDEELANMLHELSLGLSELHSTARLAHNDIKPGNIGLHNGVYTIIDLGNSTPLDTEFDESVYGFGSLYTRAPELVNCAHGVDRSKADVWSLGALIFYYLEGRFPLFDPNETYPLRDDMDEDEFVLKRQSFINDLSKRIESTWDQRVMTTTAGPLAQLVLKMLSKDPSLRPSSDAVPGEARRLLGSKLRATQIYRVLPPAVELDEIYYNLPESDDAVSISSIRRIQMRVRHLEELAGWTAIEQDKINTITARLLSLRGTDG